MHDQERTDPELHGSAVTRRAVVAGTGMLAAAAALAGCSNYGGDAGGQGGGGATAAGNPAGQGPATASGGVLVSKSDVPVGGGQILADEKIVVTQATPGQFAAFSAVCPHQGCTVNEIAGGTINCPCHQSKFAVADGQRVSGPAKGGLGERQYVEEGDQIRVT